MLDIDHSVVFRRQDGSRGSGTVVHFSSNFLVLEVYNTLQEIRLNEVFGSIRISLGQVLFYDGKGVVCEVADSSSIQLVSIYLRDSCYAVGASESDAEREMAFDRFFSHYLARVDLPIEIERKLFEFTNFLSQLLSGFRFSHLQGGLNGMSGGFSEHELHRVRLNTIEMGMKKLVESYCDLQEHLINCTEQQKSEVGELFKRYIFPLSISSRIFRHFHSQNRSPYLNQVTMQQLKADSKSNRISLKGLMLDEFFRQCAGFSDIEERLNHWIQDIRAWLGHNEGTMRVLLLGSDLTMLHLLDQLEPAEITRLKVDIVCTRDEPVERYREQLKATGIHDSALGSIRYLSVSLYYLLQLYFNKRDGEFGKYDRVYSTCFLESLSSKTAAYVIAFCLRLLGKDGSLRFFSSEAIYSPIREHWLLWFDHTLDLRDWKPYLPFESSWTQSSHACGLLTTFNPMA